MSNNSKMPKISKDLLNAAKEARELSQEDIERMAKEAQELSAELGVDIPEIIENTDSEDEVARKTAKNAAITAKQIIDEQTRESSYYEHSHTQN